MIWDAAAARTATKTCLAFGITLSGVLYLNWAVTPALVTVQTLQSALLGIAARKSVTRFLGVSVAGFISLILLGLFPQDRFALVLSYATLVAFAVFMLQGSKNPYFWIIFSFSIALVGLATGGHPLSAFNQAVGVSSSVMLGGASVILVNAILWPNPVTKAFESALAKTLQGIQKRFDTLLRILVEGDTSQSAEARELQAELLKIVAMLPTLLRNAAVEKGQMDRFSNNYLQLIDDVTVMGAEVSSFGDMLASCLASEELRSRITGLHPFNEGVARFVAELGALAEQVREGRDGSVRIDMAPSPDLSAGLELSALDEPDRAKIAALRSKADEVWSLIAAARHALANVENPNEPPVEVPDRPMKEPFSFTSFRFRWAVLVGIATVIGAYLWLLPQWPWGLKIAILVPVMGCMMIHQWPGIQRAILTGMCLAVGISWLLYFVVLPPLPNDFWFLWPAMILFLFPLVYLQALNNPFWAKVGFVGGFSHLMLVSISHFQEYSFSSWADNAIGVVTAIVFGVAFFTVAQRRPPEWAFRGTVEIFFGLCEKTMREFEDLENKPDAGRRLRSRRRALISAYEKCAELVNLLPYSRVPQNDRAKVEAFMATLWSITVRLDSMIRERILHATDGTFTSGQGAAVRRSIAQALAVLKEAAQRSESVDESALDLTGHPDFTDAAQDFYPEAKPERVSPEVAGVRLVVAGFHRSLLEAVETARQRFNLLDWMAWSLERF